MLLNWGRGSLLGAASATALIAGTAQAATPIYTGGATLGALVYRSIFDTYGAGLGGAAPPLSLTRYTTSVEIAYAGVDSGQGRTSYFGDDPTQLYLPITPWVSGDPAAKLPQDPPPYTDSLFSSYPYAGLDFVVSASPLETSLTRARLNVDLQPDTSTVATSGATSVTYNTTSWGTPAQVPAFLVSVAVPVNTTGLNNIQTKVEAAVSRGTVKSYAKNIQLSRASYCAIFGGKATDWSGLNGTTPETFVQITESTASVTSTSTTNLAADNNKLPFSTVSAPISVIYRADSSGTSSLFTQHLADVCNPLGYSFKATSTYTSEPVLPPHGIPVSGTQASAEAVSNNPGSVGYTSPEYTITYYANTTFDDGTPVPSTASLQNLYNVIHRVSHPTAPGSFIQPTATGLKYFATSLATVMPPVNSPFTAWDLNGNLDKVANVTGTGSSTAYPIGGVEYFDIYGCLNPTRTAEIAALFSTTGTEGFFPWFYVKGAASVSKIVAASGFAPLPGTASTGAGVAGQVYEEFIKGSGTIGGVAITGVNKRQTNSGAACTTGA